MQGSMARQDETRFEALDLGLSSWLGSHGCLLHLGLPIATEKKTNELGFQFPGRLTVAAGRETDPGMSQLSVRAVSEQSGNAPAAVWPGDLPCHYPSVELEFKVHNSNIASFFSPPEPVCPTSRCDPAGPAPSLQDRAKAAKMDIEVRFIS
jgi:hypothetical protein